MRKLFPNQLPLDMKKLTVLSFRNKGHLMLSMLKSIALILGGRTRPTLVRATYVTISKICVIKQNNGLKGVVKYLKTCSVISQQYLGGHHHHNLTDLDMRVSRTRLGLPRLMPVLWRQRFGKDIFLTRYILSIFAIYRILLFESPVKIKAIIAPFSGDSMFLTSLDKFIAPFFGALSKLIKSDILLDAQVARRTPKMVLSPILTKSPTTFNKVGSKVNIWSSKKISVIRSLWILMNSPSPTSLGVFKVAEYFSVPLNELKTMFCHLFDKTFNGSDLKKLESLPLGKLGLKQESAGKMRVFAMVDPITQWALQPIHEFIFSILKQIPMDGTFDQTKPLMASVNWKTLYSLDLSSATDRLPISLQRNIIDMMFPGLGQAWSDSLVDRFYSLPNSDQKYQYAVGQPMGAYSSWAMLALTHHFIVQVAAWTSHTCKVGTAFLDYAVLGDDIVIGNKAVQQKYRAIISLIGVECGLHKSLLSPRGSALEFAKRTWMNNNDVTPVSIKELVASLQSIQSLSALAQKYQISIPTLVKIAGFGYKVLGGLNKPFYALNQTVRNIIINMIFPLSQSEGEIFGRTSLTRFSWDPIMDLAVTELLVSFLKDLELRLFNAIRNGLNHPDLKHETTRLYISNIYVQEIQGILKKVSKLRELLQGPLSVTVTPLEAFKTYRTFLIQSGSYFELINLAKATAKAGVDPFLVKTWKVWSKSLTKFSKMVDAMSKASQTESMRESNIFILAPLLRFLPRVKILKRWRFLGQWSWWFGKNTMLLSFGPLIFYLLEWTWMIAGLLLALGSIMVLYDPVLFQVVIYPFLLSVLGHAYSQGLMCALGIKHVAVWSYWTYPFIAVKCSIGFVLGLADTCVNYLVWYNEFIFKVLYSSFGIIGTWAAFKVFAMLKFVWAATTHTMLTGGFTGPIMWLSTFLVQMVTITFMTPLMELYNNVTLSNILLLLIPDPLGVWNYLIAVNILPWAFLNSIVHESIPFVTVVTSVLISGWNLAISDISWMGLNEVLTITTPTADIVSFIFGSLDRRLGSIVQNIHNLRNIWR